VLHVALLCAGGPLSAPASAQPSGEGRVLFVGGGGGIGPRQCALAWPEANIDVVELESEVIALGGSQFGFTPSLRSSIHCGDGLRFLADSDPAHYDAIVIDAFVGDRPAAAFLSPEGARLIRRCLKRTGAVAINVAAAMTGDAIVPELVRVFGTAPAPGTLSLLPVLDPEESIEDWEPHARRNVALVVAPSGLPSPAALLAAAAHRFAASPAITRELCRAVLAAFRYEPLCGRHPSRDGVPPSSMDRAPPSSMNR
jgi:hypothetical protein